MTSPGPGALSYTGATATYGFTPLDPIPAVPQGPGSLVRSAWKVENVDEGDERWGAGLTVLPEGSSIGVAAPELNQSSYQPTSLDGTNINHVPVALLYAIPVSTLQNRYYGTEGWRARLLREMDQMTSTLMELELWNGTIAQAQGFPNRYLRDTSAVLVSKAALAPLEAVARLEQALSPVQTADPNDPMAYTPSGVGQPGTIHLTIEAGSLLSGIQSASPSDGRIFTKLGNSVVIGSGYSGTGPTTFANGAGDTLPVGQGTVLADTSWAYATDVMRVRLGPIHLVGDESDLPPEVSGLYDRDRNTAYRYAWRLSAAWWEGQRHYACLVDHFGLHKQTTGTQPD